MRFISEEFRKDAASTTLKSLIALQPPFYIFLIQAPLSKQNMKIPKKLNYLELLRTHDTTKSIQGVLA